VLPVIGTGGRVEFTATPIHKLGVVARCLRIGVDVGGTNTDAVLMHGHRVLAEVKTPTTADVASGIRNALHTLLAQAAVEPQAVHAVMVGTTQFTNAIVVGKGLLPTAAVRLGLPATQALPPMVDWPPHLSQLLGAHVYLCHGGCEFDGRPLSPVDAGELRRVADIASKGLRSIAICSVFSPVNDEPEQQAAEIFAAELPGIAITRSGEIGRDCWSGRTRQSSTLAFVISQLGSSPPCAPPSLSSESPDGFG
jgi:N-methylhydantoinase A/oxoprolinase/acetone carboxylase beta subunit